MPEEIEKLKKENRLLREQNRELRRKIRKLKKAARLGKMDVILIFVAITLLVFTVVMIYLYRETGAIPDQLCICVFAVLGGECGAMAWIKTTKERRTEREWQLQDREHEEQKQQEEKNTPEGMVNNE